MEQCVSRAKTAATGNHIHTRQEKPLTFTALKKHIYGSVLKNGSATFSIGTLGRYFYQWISTLCVPPIRGAAHVTDISNPVAVSDEAHRLMSL